MSHAELPTEPKLSTETTKRDPFWWIVDTDELRSEGVIYGQNFDDPEPKLQIIREYYDGFLDIEQYHADELTERLNRSSDRLAAAEQDKEHLSQRLSTPLDRERLLPHLFGRYLVGVAFALTLVIANFFLIYNWLQPYSTSELLTALGLYGVAIFGVMLARQVFLPATPDPKFAYVFGVQLVLPILITAYFTANAAIPTSAAQYIFFFLTGTVLLLVAGKILLALLPRLWDSWVLLSANLKQRAIHTRRWIEARRATRRNEQLLIELYAEQAKLRTDRDARTDQVRHLRRECQTRCKLFLSEFYLAHRNRYPRPIEPLRLLENEHSPTPKLN